MRRAALALCALLAGCGALPGGHSALVSEVAPGVELPFGQVAEVCDLPRRDLGRAVAQAPEGKGRYTLYDTAPGSTGPRTQYITGFSDGCPRQITAALVTFGTASVHEATRYAGANGEAYSPTDTAYEELRAPVCKVEPGTPCPADRLARLESRLAFVTAYPRFGASARRLELLLHDGRVAAEAAFPR